MSKASVQVRNRLSFAREWLEGNTALTAENRDSLARLVACLADSVNGDRNTVIGIAGAPGCGKTTLAGALAHCLGASGIPACCLSLDDYYLGSRERGVLAREVHPLFRQRGAPGTHEIDLLTQHLDCIREGAASGLQLPAFDKSSDDRLPLSHWRRLEVTPRITLLEGWCVGAPPQAVCNLQQACNEFELRHDPDGRWRAAMHRAWKELYRALNLRLDSLWYIRTPEWERVIDWRWQQEQQLKNRNLASREDVALFLARFERIVIHMQASCEEWADRILVTNQQHEISFPGKDQ